MVMKIDELYLKTLFCCSACDGEIAPEEVALVKELSENDSTFDGLDIESMLNDYVNQINSKGRLFLKEFLYEVADASLSEEEQIKVFELAVKMVEADNQILYSEVKFIKKLRRNLPVSDEAILNVMPGAEDYLLPEIVDDSKEEEWSNITFVPIHLS